MIKQAKAWVRKHAAVVGTGMFVVRVALAAGRAVGVPLPGLSLADVGGTHMEATLRMARAAVGRMESE